jgi:hypothetical protein
MQSAFAERLDAHLASQDRRDVAVSRVATAAWNGPAIPWFPGAARFRAARSSGAASRQPAPAVVARCERALTPGERAALDLLGRASGCQLDAAFDGRLLRRAFRAAARRLHPDAHPAADQAERERLGAAFVAVRAAYLTLLPLGGE